MPLPARSQPNDRPALPRLLRAGLLTGVTDGLFASVLSVAFYHSTVTRAFQGVAGTVLGRVAFEGGTKTALLGVLMHFGVAFGWSAAFLLLHDRWPWLRERLGSTAGRLKAAALYGPGIWLVMSLVVIPLLLQGPPTITARWWIQLVGHFPFVGIPLVWLVSKGHATSETTSHWSSNQEAPGSS